MTISSVRIHYTPSILFDGERPDRVSYKMYGDEQYYWIVLQVNEITDVYNQWALSDRELEEYVAKKYGPNGASEIHHYETVETVDSDGNLVLPGGLVVPEDYSFTHTSEINGGTVYKTSRPLYVTNVAYERALNDKKSEIFVLIRSIYKTMFESLRTTQ